MRRVYVCHAESRWYSPAKSAPATKIGVSARPERRKWGLRRKGCEHPTLIWMSDPMPHAHAFEAVLKYRFARRAVQGTEWFALKPETVIRAARKLLRDFDPKRARTKRGKCALAATL